SRSTDPAGEVFVVRASLPAENRLPSRQTQSEERVRGDDRYCYDRGLRAGRRRTTRERERHRCTPPNCARGPNAATVRLDDPLADRQTETGARGASTRLPVAIKNMREIRFRDPAARILDRDAHRVSGHHHLHSDLSAFGSEL